MQFASIERALLRGFRVKIICSELLLLLLLPADEIIEIQTAQIRLNEGSYNVSLSLSPPRYLSELNRRRFICCSNKFIKREREKIPSQRLALCSKRSKTFLSRMRSRQAGRREEEGIFSSKFINKEAEKVILRPEFN
jgi:hypothetical protein